MSKTVDAFIDGVIDREGDYVDHPSDRGGPTRWGVTEAVARAFGYDGPMHELPQDTARAIYRRRYWDEPGFGKIAKVSEAIADELFDTGVNMGTGKPAEFLQRALNSLNSRGKLFPDLTVDGRIGSMTVAALEKQIARRGRDGELVVLRLLNAQQAVRYMDIAENRESQEDFMYGWIRTRVA
jgi:lysozyme family protein